MRGQVGRTQNEKDMERTGRSEKERKEGKTRDGTWRSGEEKEEKAKDGMNREI